MAITMALLGGCGGGGGGGSSSPSASAAPSEALPPAMQTLSLAISGSGSVVSTPPGLDCSPGCSARFPIGAKVALSATPANGYAFSGWADACSGDGACAVTISSAQAVTAVFAAIPPVAAAPQTLTVTISGSGSVVSKPSGLNCSANCSVTFPNDTPVTLSVTPANGYAFSGWSGACAGAGSCTVTMASAQAVTAVFVSSPPAATTQTLTLAILGSGSVMSTPAGLSCSADCSASFPNGTAVALTVTPASGYAFSNWAGGCSGAGPCTVTMGSAQAVTAVFASSTSPGGDAPTAASASTVGPYTVENYSAAIPVTPNYVQPTIYYPTNAPSPLPGVVFVTGLCETYEARTNQPQYFTQWGTLLASHGFIVMFVNTSVDGCTSIQQTTLADALSTLVGENARTGGPLLGMVDAQRLAFMGHSTGGSAVFLAAMSNANPGLKAAVGLCPVAMSPYYPSDATPGLIIAGVDDPHTSDTLAQYGSIPITTPKVYAEFSPVSTVLVSMHHIADEPLGGTNVTDPIVARIGLSFLETYVAGDLRYAAFLVSDPTMADFLWNP